MQDDLLATGISAWHRAGMKYDVRNMSRDDLRGLAQNLFIAGAIGLGDCRLLSLEPVTYPSEWPGWSAFETSGQSDGRRDWIGEIRARIRKGYPEQAYQQALLSFLERVEAARQRMLAVSPARTEPAPRRSRLSWAGLRSAYFTSHSSSAP